MSLIHSSIIHLNVWSLEVVDIKRLVTLYSCHKCLDGYITLRYVGDAPESDIRKPSEEFLVQRFVVERIGRPGVRFEI